MSTALPRPCARWRRECRRRWCEGRSRPSAPSCSRRGSCRGRRLRRAGAALRACGAGTGARPGCCGNPPGCGTGGRRRGTDRARPRAGRGAVRSLETETGLQIADVLGRGNARFTILIHETPPAWLRHARYVCSGGVWRSKKTKADTATTEARTILTPSEPVKRTPPKHSVFVAAANELSRRGAAELKRGRGERSRERRASPRDRRGTVANVQRSERQERFDRPGRVGRQAGEANADRLVVARDRHARRGQHVVAIGELELQPHVVAAPGCRPARASAPGGCPSG